MLAAQRALSPIRMGRQVRGCLSQSWAPTTHGESRTGVQPGQGDRCQGLQLPVTQGPTSTEAHEGNQRSQVTNSGLCASQGGPRSAEIDS